MEANRKYGILSFLTASIGVVLLGLSYGIQAPIGLIKTLFFSGGLLLVFSLVCSVLGIKRKESGLTKYSGIATMGLIVLGIVLTPVLLGLFGFNNP